MNWISNLEVRNWRQVNLAAIALLSALFIVNPLDMNRFVSQAGTTVFYSPFYLLKNSFADLIEVAEENARLRQSLIETSTQMSLLEEAGRENIRLRQVLGFQSPGSYHLLPAKVVSVRGGNLLMDAIINRGSNDSVCVDAPVINQDGLIGRIISVTPDFATVQLLTDPANRVAARVASSREMGIVRCLTPDEMILSNFPIQGSINVGDLIVSSGLGGIYTAGLTIGTVVEINRPEGKVFCHVKLEPAANFHSIEELFVLRFESP